MNELNVRQMTHTALERFARAVDTVLTADGVTPIERMCLISHWAYQYERPDMPLQLGRAIARCQSNEWEHPTATSVVNKVSGEVTAYNPG